MTVITTLLVLLHAGSLKSALDGLIEAERAFACLSVEKGSMQDSSDFKISYCPRFGFRTLVKSWRMRLSAMT